MDTPVQKWMGMPKNRLKTAPDCHAPLPKLEPTRNHTVLFDVRIRYLTDYCSNMMYCDVFDFIRIKYDECVILSTGS